MESEGWDDDADGLGDPEGDAEEAIARERLTRMAVRPTSATHATHSENHSTDAWDPGSERTDYNQGSSSAALPSPGAQAWYVCPCLHAGRCQSLPMDEDHPRT